jgi:hypothetical protein
MKYSIDNNIKLLYFPNEFKVKRKNNYHGTYVAHHCEEKIPILMDWLENNTWEKFYFMGTIESLLKLKLKFGDKIIYTKSREIFFENVETVVYPKVSTFFEFSPNFIKESVNCDCNVIQIGIDRPDGVDDIINKSSYIYNTDWLNFYNRILQ